MKPPKKKNQKQVGTWSCDCILLHSWFVMASLLVDPLSLCSIYSYIYINILYTSLTLSFDVMWGKTAITDLSFTYLPS